MRLLPRHLPAAIGISLALVWGLSCRSDGSTSPEPIAAVVLTPPSGAVNVGSTLALTAQAQDAKGNVLTGRAIVFVSSDTNMATVSAAGVVTGIAPGSVNVTATADTKSAQSVVTVSAVRDDWTTYGHDVRRTSASLGSVTGPLSLSWSYVPQGTGTHALNSVLSAIGTANAVFVRTSLNSGYGYGISPAIDRVSPAGQHVWTYNMGTDADFGDWASLMGNRVIVNSDGTRFVDQTSGLSVHSNGVDTWGEILTDSSTLYFANDVQIDGPGIYAAAYEPPSRRAGPRTSSRAAAAPLRRWRAASRSTTACCSTRRRIRWASRQRCCRSPPASSPSMRRRARKSPITRARRIAE